jgi:uncharacterized membrane protein YjjB (DUF3815 family)
MPLITNAFWAGCFAAGLGLLLTTPPQGLLPCFACGLAGRLVRNLVVAAGASATVGVVLGAVVCVVVASALSHRGQTISPLVMVTGVLPLGAAVPLFKSVYGLLTLPAVPGDALTDPVVQLVANLSTVFTTTLAMVLGVWLGLFVMTALGQKDHLLRH